LLTVRAAKRGRTRISSDPIRCLKELFGLRPSARPPAGAADGRLIGMRAEDAGAPEKVPFAILARGQDRALAQLARAGRTPLPQATPRRARGGQRITISSARI
jgi:hypothetical protein